MYLYEICGDQIFLKFSECFRQIENMGVRLVIIQLIDRDSAQMNPRFFLYSSILSDRLGAESRSNTFAAELPSDARTG